MSVVLTSSNAVAWISDTVLVSPQLAGLGAVTFVVALIYMAMLGVRAISRGFSRIRARMIDAGLQRDKTVDQRILIAAPTGLRGRSTLKFVRTGLETYLPEFSFGTPVRLVNAGHVELDRLPERLTRSDAEGIMHVECTMLGESELVLSGVTRRLGRAEPVPFEFQLPKSSKARDDGLAEIISYLVARSLQPTLARPQDFRVERVETLATALNRMRESEAPVSRDIMSLIERDFCACALHLAEAGNVGIWLDAVISLRQSQLESDNIDDTLERAEVRIDMGRALIALASEPFDPALLQQGMDYVHQGVEAMRKLRAMDQLELADRAVGRGKALLSNRQRFSVTGGI